MNDVMWTLGFAAYTCHRLRLVDKKFNITVAAM